MATRNIGSSKKIIVGITTPLAIALLLGIFYFLLHQQPATKEILFINFLSKGRLLADQTIKELTLLPKDSLAKGRLTFVSKNELEDAYNKAMYDFNSLIDTFIYCLNRGDICIGKLEDYIKAAQTSEEKLKKLLDNKAYKEYQQSLDRKVSGLNIVINNPLEGSDKIIKSLEGIMAKREMFERIIEQVKAYRWLSLSLPKS